MVLSHENIRHSILKVRQIRNDFFKPSFLPKNVRTNSTLLFVDLFYIHFLEESDDTKKTFQNNWPLENGNFYFCLFSVLNLFLNRLGVGFKNFWTSDYVIYDWSILCCSHIKKSIKFILKQKGWLIVNSLKRW